MRRSNNYLYFFSRYLILILSLYSLVFPAFGKISSSCGKKWEWNNELPQDNDLKGVGWSQELQQWIAVGDLGTILSSKDGNTWQLQISHAVNNLNGIFWNGSIWVVVGNEGTILTSLDGVLWQTQNSNTSNNLNAIHWNGTQWLAVGDLNTILISADAVLWQKINPTNDEIASFEDKWKAVHWNGSQWLLVSFSGKKGLSSEDGFSWKNFNFPFESTNSQFHLLYGIHWNGSRWIAVGYSQDIFFWHGRADYGQVYGRVHNSGDTLVWPETFTFVSVALHAIYSNASLSVTVGRRGGILTSTDDVSWEKQNSGTDNHLRAIYSNGDQWVAVGDKATIIKSTDGILWQTNNTFKTNNLSLIYYLSSEWSIPWFYDDERYKIKWVTSKIHHITIRKEDEIIPDRFDGYNYYSSPIKKGSVWTRSTAWDTSLLSSTDSVFWHVEKFGRDWKLIASDQKGLELISLNNGNKILADACYTDIRQFVTQFYQFVLSREPDEAGLDFWVNALVSNELTGKDIVNNFILSPEFTDRQITNQEFVMILYHTLFNREPDSNEVSHWVTQLEAGREDQEVVNGFLISQEFSDVCNLYQIDCSFPQSQEILVSKFVSRFYQQFLLREPDIDGLNDWVDGLINGHIKAKDLAYAFLLSDEFSNSTIVKDEHNKLGFLGILYRTLFDREPDTVGFDFWASELNSGQTFQEILDKFLLSAEFLALCNEHGMNCSD